MSGQFAVASSPHMREGSTTRRIMTDVLLALLPATAASVWFFGPRALLVAAVSILTAVGWEWASRRLMKRPDAIGDLSAVVTGLLLALNLPPSIPLWIAAVGTFLAIVVIKQLFGGIGQNFMNPALGARAILIVAYGQAMTTWTAPGGGVDAVSIATPLMAMREGGSLPALADMFLGRIGGSLGETSALAILIGFAWLLFRKVISWRIPVLMCGATALTVWILGPAGLFTGDPLRHVLSGGLLLGAVFMATDYSTSPVTRKGVWIYGIGCGLLTAVFRLYTSMPEGVSFAIILMNSLTPLLDRITIPVPFGGDRRG
jgi:electron transport complex protein RnfD